MHEPNKLDVKKFLEKWEPILKKMIADDEENLKRLKKLFKLDEENARPEQAKTP